MELRHRGNRSDINQMETFQISESSDNTKDDEPDEAIRDQKCLSAIPTILISFAVLFILNVFVYEMDNMLPGTVETNSSYDYFVANRAMSTLVKLANFGPRPVGSDENEKLAFNLFKTEIENIMNDPNNIYDIQMLNQKVSGSFVLNMKNWKYLLSYEDLQNVVVKLNPNPKQGVNESILLNCHYDTVPAGPGVSDNGVNCAVMVELLRILAKSPGLRRPIIFLFNGGEEIILQASHGFVTQHPWARDPKYIINLDSCGAGGREILFQTTVIDSYLVGVYAESVPHPYGQTIGEELFQSGVIPSDTDFRVFRDFGNMSGLDLAHYKNGYVYHTAHDDLNKIEPSVLQNTGENLFKLVKALSTHNATKNGRKKYVFFDVLGMYMFSYTELSGTVANFLIVFTSFFSICLSLKFTAARMNRREYSLHLLTTAIVGPACTILLAIVSCLIVAFFFDLSSNSMSWYSSQMNLAVYFVTATLVVLCSTVFHPRTKSRTDAQWIVSLLNGVQFFWTALLFIATMAGLRSAYVFAVIVLPPSIAGCALGVLNTHRTPLRWIAVYVASLLLPVVFVCYLTQMVTSLFVPLSGRTGPDVNPDYIVATLMAVSAYATVGYVSPIAVLVKNPRTLLVTVAGCALMFVVLACATPLGFPYSVTANQRFDLVHTRRTFYGYDRSVRLTDSGVLVVNWDRRGSRTVVNHVPRMAEAVPVDCTGELMCGVPLVGKLAALSDWIPATRPPILPSAFRTVQAVGGTVSAGPGPVHQRRMEFTVTGPERIAVYVSPYPGTRLKSWSFPDKPEVTTRWQGNDVYVIRHSSGTVKNELGWKFWLEQESDYGFEKRTINVTVTYSWVIHKQLVFELEDEFETLVSSFPPWAHVNYAVASVDAYIF